MNEILTASTGVIMSQSPGSGFPHFESCSWVVKVEPGYNITFTIEHFQTSRQFDELEIFDGESAFAVLDCGNSVWVGCRGNCCSDWSQLFWQSRESWTEQQLCLNYGFCWSKPLQYSWFFVNALSRQFIPLRLSSASLPTQFVSPAPNYQQPLKNLTKVLF